MKAKYFKKLRATTDWYDVEVTKGLFGKFSGFGEEDFITVRAKDYQNACLRACRRGYGQEHWGSWSVTTEEWAHFAVKLSSKSRHWKNISFRGN